ncbi:hypothetical protein VTK73DRAFT_8924 [Phialemonium thermophilum]|uniref:Uncharacterized protein n=1 Tax=Phialemonium thermophilum TaxID=223376 RepID=A0ABR3W5G6_9PEZI
MPDTPLVLTLRSDYNHDLYGSGSKVKNVNVKLEDVEDSEGNEGLWRWLDNVQEVARDTVEDSARYASTTWAKDKIKEEVDSESNDGMKEAASEEGGSTEQVSSVHQVFFHQPAQSRSNSPSRPYSSLSIQSSMHLKRDTAFAKQRAAEEIDDPNLLREVNHFIDQYYQNFNKNQVTADSCNRFARDVEEKVQASVAAFYNGQPWSHLLPSEAQILAVGLCDRMGKTHRAIIRGLLSCWKA